MPIEVTLYNCTQSAISLYMRSIIVKPGANTIIRAIDKQSVLLENEHYVDY